MKVAIVRHGSAASGDVYDRSRALTERGHEHAKAAGEWLASQSFQSPRLLASPYLRAQQTAEEIAATFDVSIETFADLVPDGDLRQLVETLTASKTDIILVSHLPLVGHLAALLVDGEVYEQPWSLAECWVLKGDIAAASCMEVESVWYPVLAGL